MSDCVIDQSLKIAAAFSDKLAASQCFDAEGGHLLLSRSETTSHLPFAALLLTTTDNVAALQEAADVGAYLVCERTIRNQPLDSLSSGGLPGSVGIFTLVANPNLGATASDAHWRDKHAPLALEVHTLMTHYYQLSVQHRFGGPDWNGFALCCFATDDDLRHRFFNSDVGRNQVNRDVSEFADTRRSPRRVIATITAGQR